MSGGGTSPVITLLTDFGTQDIYVGVMRGVISNLAPEARIVDLTHEVRPQAVSDAAFLLDAAAPYFPWGTIHVAVVDPGVGTQRKILCVRTSRATYIAPDNGLLTRVLERDPPARIVSVENRHYFLPDVSGTFHGRDVFAPVAAHLACGVDPTQLGPELDRIRPLELPGVKQLELGALGGEVIYVDRFGNLVTNVPLAGLPQVATVLLGETTVAGPVRHSYAECEPGELLLVAGSSGLLEVSVNLGSAERRLGAQRGDPVRVSVQPIEPSEVP
jgi:S-adenosylmethionine hydrolase